MKALQLVLLSVLTCMVCQRPPAQCILVTRPKNPDQRMKENMFHGLLDETQTFEDKYSIQKKCLLGQKDLFFQCKYFSKKIHCLGTLPLGYLDCTDMRRFLFIYFKIECKLTLTLYLKILIKHNNQCNELHTVMRSVFSYPSSKVD